MAHNPAQHSRQPKAAQQATMDKLFAGDDPAGAYQNPRRQKVLSTGWAWEGKAITCHRVVDRSAAGLHPVQQLFRIAPDGAATPI